MRLTMKQLRELTDVELCDYADGIVPDRFKVTKSEMGKKSKSAGMRFELKVRKDLESQGWIVDKWTNNVEFLYQAGNWDYIEDAKVGKMHPAKSNRFNMRSTGFPDFIAFRMCEDRCFKMLNNPVYEVIVVEVKSNGTLRKIEKEKCQWYLDNNIFSKILIASKGDSRGEIVYKEFVRGLKK